MPLPPNVPKRGLNLDEAAEYCGVSSNTLSRHGRPSIKIVDRKIYDRRSLDQWLDEAHEGDSSRPGRRLSLIDAALETLHDVPPQVRRKLRNAAALAIGMEAVISLRDVCGLDRREARATARWALEAMVTRALSKR